MNKIHHLRFIPGMKMFRGNHDINFGLFQQLGNRSMSASMLSPELRDREVFRNELPAIANKIISSPKIAHLPEIGQWIKKVLSHNLKGGIYAKSMMTIDAYEMLEKPENITEKYLQLARVLGWCVVMSQASICIEDDIMDRATTRQGAPCWYLMPNVGIGAINDALFLTCCVNETLEMYFGKTPHYLDLVKTFNEIMMYSAIGQHQDFAMAKHRSQQDYSMFTQERYLGNSPYKCAHFAFRFPMRLGLTLVKDLHPSIPATLDEITLKLGYLYQMLDDYLDCFGDYEVTGKAGTDIQEGKCTWMSVTALEQCNEAQRERFVKYFGSWEPEHVEEIKSLYQELNLPEIYKQQDKELQDEVIRLVSALPEERATNFYLKVLKRLYKNENNFAVEFADIHL